MGLHGPLTEQQRDALGRVTRAQERLLGLINDVLNFARLEAGRVEYDIKPVRVTDVMHEVAALMAPQFAARDLNYTVRVPDGVDGDAIAVLADREKLAQVLLNLLSNAAKFTPTGGCITVEADPTPAGAERVAIRVKDTGVGIAADKLQSIFEPFVQLGRGLKNTQEGTGLGLAISRELARGMNGELVAESEPGVGSTFTLTLPTSRA
jgi:signal transduction histidine kinase